MTSLCHILYDIFCIFLYDLFYYLYDLFYIFLAFTSSDQPQDAFKEVRRIIGDILGLGR